MPLGDSASNQVHTFPTRLENLLERAAELEPHLRVGLADDLRSSVPADVENLVERKPQRTSLLDVTTSATLYLSIASVPLPP